MLKIRDPGQEQGHLRGLVLDDEGQKHVLGHWGRSRAKGPS